MSYNSIVLIYQLGKVGSSTVYTTLKDVFGDETVIHIHFLSESFKKRAEGLEKYNWHINHIKKVENLKSKNTQSRIKIVSLAREPVARNISGIFQNLENYLPNNGRIDDVNVDELIEMYKNKNNYNYTQNWFDDEFKEYTGVDIYKWKFDTNKGFTIINTKNYDILLLTLESINRSYKEAFKKFFGININKLHLSNESSKKNSAELNRQLKQKISFSIEELNEVYSSKYVKHFYEKNAIEKFISKWT
jgi:hypothetical protein